MNRTAIPVHQCRDIAISLNFSPFRAVSSDPSYRSRTPDSQNFAKIWLPWQGKVKGLVRKVALHASG
jgi:hypothetical protein